VLNFGCSLRFEYANDGAVPADVRDLIDVTSLSGPFARRSDLPSGISVHVDSTPSPSRAIVEGGWTALRWRRVSVLSSSPLKASISRFPSASTDAISWRISWAVCRFSSSKTLLTLVAYLFS
jgi:hypothetical protein